jgi:hypothetical protein
VLVAFMFIINSILSYYYLKSDSFYLKSHEVIKNLENNRKISDALSYCRIVNIYNNNKLSIIERRLYNKLLIATSLSNQYKTCSKSPTNTCFEVLQKGLSISDSFDGEKENFNTLVKELIQMSLSAHVKLKENDIKESRSILNSIDKKFKNFGHTRYILDAIQDRNADILNKFKEIDSASYCKQLENMYVL